MDELRVRVLGTFEIEGVPAAALGSRKGRRLLALLVLGRGRPVHLDRIVDALWGDALPARPAEQVQVLVSRLRRTLGAQRIVRAGGGYRVVVDWLDLDVCEQLTEEAERRLAAGQVASARAAAGAALELARGPLLPDEPDAPWAQADRVAAERLAGRARQAAASAALAAGDLADAAAAAAAALDHDPYDEVALRTLMTSQARAGRPGSALAAYARVRARLAEDLGVSPTPETEALHTRILLGTEGPPPSPARRSGATVLAGRDAELAALDAALERAKEHGCELVVVEGEAGIGKTRLVTTWLAGARERATVLVGTCDELSQGLPLQAVVDAVEGYFHGIEAAEIDALIGPDHDVLAPLFGRTPTMPVPLALAAPALNPLASDPSLLHLALVGLLARLAARYGPTVLVLDDVHLAGVATARFLRLAVHRLNRSPLLLVATQRLEEAVELPASVRMTLGPLTLAAAAAVVGHDRAAELHARTGGHPLFLTELAQAPPGDELPASVREAVVARCERAGPQVAATLRAAAVLGETIDLDVLASALGASPVGLLDHLEEGARRMILEERRSGFAFRHALVREALASGTSAARRALLHRQAARALAHRRRTDPLVVAHHARLGGDVDLAAAALVDAATAAVRRGDLGEAERLLTESIELADTPGARVARSRVRVMAGKLDEADADAAAALATGGGAPARESAAWVAHYRRDFASAVRLADEGARLATDAAARAACLMVGGYASHCRGDLDEADSRFRSAADTGAPYESVIASMWRGALLIHRGDAERGLQLVRTARQAGIAPAHGDPHAHALFFEALGLGTLGRAEESLAVLADLGSGPRLQGSRWPARAANTRGWILRNLGEHGAADEANEAALALATAASHVEPAVHAYLDLAAGRLLAGDLDGASSHLASAEAMRRKAHHSMQWRNEMRQELLAARLALATGDFARAESAAESLGSRAEAAGVARYRTLAALVVAEARIRAGEPVDHGQVERLLAELPTTAGLEAWWLTAAMADAARIDAWRRLAETRVVELAAHAGRHRPALERAAARLLEGKGFRRQRLFRAQ